VNIEIRGEFIANAGFQGGDLILGDVEASGISLNTGSSGGTSSPTARVGNVQARSLYAFDDGFATIRVNADRLTVGEVLVDNGSSGFGSVELNANEIRLASLGVVNGSSSGFAFITAGKLQVTGDTFVSGIAFVLADQGAEFQGDFYADALFANASDGGLFFRGHTAIGSLALPPEFGDAAVISALGEFASTSSTKLGIPISDGLIAGPNAVFRARDGILLGDGLHVIDGDTPYVVFQTDGILDFGPGVTASAHQDFIAQFTTFSPEKTLLVEDSPALGNANFFNSLHFSKLPGTTIVLGSEAFFGTPHLGSIIAAAQGPLDIGSQNILFVTRGQTLVGAGFKTTGLFGALRFINGKATLVDPNSFTLEQKFPIPIVDEFNLDDTQKEKDEDLYVQVENGDGSLSEQLVSQQSNTGQMCQ